MSREENSVYQHFKADILHLGYVKYSEEGAKVWRCFNHGLNADNSVKKLKGNSRPIKAKGWSIHFSLIKVLIT